MVLYAIWLGIHLFIHSTPGKTNLLMLFCSTGSEEQARVIIQK